MAIKKVVVVKIGVDDAKSQKAAKKALVDVKGFSYLLLDFERSTLVAKGDVDPIVLVEKLRKFVSAKLVTFGPENDEGQRQPQQQQQEQQQRERELQQQQQRERELQQQKQRERELQQQKQRERELQQQLEREWLQQLEREWLQQQPPIYPPCHYGNGTYGY